MKIIPIGKFYPVQEAMSLLFMAANQKDYKETDYMRGISPLGQEDDGQRQNAVALQEEFLRLISSFPLSHRALSYFERFYPDSLDCVATCLIETFRVQETEDTGQMCRIVKNAFSAFSPESFPSFCAVSGGLVLQKDRRSLLDSLRFLELEEKFLARLMFALQDPVRALEELCPLIDRAISALSPFREQMEAEAKKTARRWADYFSNRGFSSFESDTGIHVDESRYEAAVILPSLVNGIHFSLDMDSCRTEEKDLHLRIGFLVRESALPPKERIPDLGALSMLCDPTRLKILAYIRKTPRFGREIAEHFGLTTATISYHMSELLQQGLIEVSQQGRRIYYRLNEKRVRQLLDSLAKQLLCQDAP